MQFEFLSPPTPHSVDSEGKITETLVIIKCDEPYTILTGILQGDWTNRSKEEVIEAVKEYNHKILFVERAMSEAVLLVDDLKKQTEGFKKEQKETKDNFTKLLEEIKKENKVQLDLAVADLTNLIMGMMTGMTTEEGVSEDVTTE